MKRRVVITGIGAVTGHGIGAAALWEGLIAGRATFGPATALDASGFKSNIVSEVKGFSAKDYVPKHYRKAVKVMARDTELAVGAAKLAVEDAGIVTRASLGDHAEGATTYPQERMACQIGAGLLAAETEELTTALVTARREDGDPAMRGFSMRAWGDSIGPDGAAGGDGMENLTPLWLLKYLPNMLACHVTIIHGAEGPSNTITCSEASGLLSIGESARVIERGMADLAFSGSAESRINPVGLTRFWLSGRLADTTDGIGHANRPYDPGSAGALLGEAAGILILEEESAARARGANVYCRVSGFGAASGTRVVAGRPWAGFSSEGLHDAIDAARDAGVSAAQIDAIVPHASGTPEIDREEHGALREVFGARLSQVPMITLAPTIGDSIAGNGGIMAAAGALAIRHQELPARVHEGEPVEVMAGPAAAARAEVNHVLVCTGSLGGQNAAVVLSKA